MNKVILVGNCTKDGELRYSQSGMAIYNNSIAVSKKFTKDGVKKEEVMFVDFTAFNRTGEICNQYLRKGSKILVEGRLNFDQWVDQQGQKRSKHSVVVETMQMLDSKNDQNPRADGYSNDGQQQKGMNSPVEYQQAPSKDSVPVIDISEDEVPF